MHLLKNIFILSKSAVEDHDEGENMFENEDEKPEFESEGKVFDDSDVGEVGCTGNKKKTSNSNCPFPHYYLFN